MHALFLRSNTIRHEAHHFYLRQGLRDDQDPACAGQTASGASMIYLNGQWQPLARTSVSVLDRGFLFADGV